MAYISSNDNRFYVALETAYGQAPTVAAANRIPAVQLTSQYKVQKGQRKDKTGTRTFLGDPTELRSSASFGLKTYLTNWANTTQPPAYGPLVQAAFGAAPMMWTGGTVLTAGSSGQVVFTGPHNLATGQAVSSGGEIRFVTSVVSAQTVQLNAPFSTSTSAGTLMTTTATYQTASDLPSVSIFDYWSPGTAVQRLLYGGAVNEVKLMVNGDFHEFTFSGAASDVADSASFQSGQAGMQAFPLEPAVAPLTYSLVPGHLGEVWMGGTSAEFFTVTKAQLTFTNDLDLRSSEFGSQLARGISPGIRNVSVEFSLYQQDDSITPGLYQAARQRSPVPVMLQLGQQQGQMFGLYMSSVVPEVPEFDDSDKRQQWHFVNCRAQGVLNDEIFVAFG
jgi:hypothetical protein